MTTEERTELQAKLEELESKEFSLEMVNFLTPQQKTRLDAIRNERIRISNLLLTGKWQKRGKTFKQFKELIIAEWSKKLNTKVDVTYGGCREDENIWDIWVWVEKA